MSIFTYNNSFFNQLFSPKYIPIINNGKIYNISILYKNSSNINIPINVLYDNDNINNLMLHIIEEQRNIEKGYCVVFEEEIDFKYEINISLQKKNKITMDDIKGIFLDILINLVENDVDIYSLLDIL